MGKVQSNPDSRVKKITTLSFLEIQRSPPPPLKDALASLSDELCGVGPATASAILAALDGTRYPFMADEALEGCGLKRDYTPSAYASFAERLITKASSLGGDWTAETVGRALWTQAILSAHCRVPSAVHMATTAQPLKRLHAEITEEQPEAQGKGKQQKRKSRSAPK